MVKFFIAIMSAVTITSGFAYHKHSLKIAEEESKKIKVVHTTDKIKFDRLDVFCLAKNIYHEAGIEDDIGKFAVAQVTINRLKDRNYPNTICKVVMDPFQFSWTINRNLRWSRPKGELWEESMRIAELVLYHGKRVQNLENALFYHADYVSPHWKKYKIQVAQLGAHIFYERK